MYQKAPMFHCTMIEITLTHQETTDHVSQILSFHGKLFEGEREVPSKP